MLNQFAAILCITVLPLALAIVAYRHLPATRFEVGGSIGGVRVDAAGALAVYVLIAGVSWKVWEEYRPAAHERWAVYKVVGEGQLPEGYDPAQFDRMHVGLVLNPRRQTVSQPGADGRFDWTVDVPVIVAKDEKPDLRHTIWNPWSIAISYAPRQSDDADGRQLIADSPALNTDSFVADTENRVLTLTDAVEMRQPTVSRTPDGGRDGVQENMLAFEEARP